MAEIHPMGCLVMQFYCWYMLSIITLILHLNLFQIDTLKIHMTYIFMLATKVVTNFVTERMSVTSCITNLKNKKSIKRRRFESWKYKTLIPSTFYIKCLNTRRDLRIWYNASTWYSAEIIGNLRKDRGMHYFSLSQITFVLDFDFFL